MYTDEYKIILDSINLIDGSCSVYIEHIIKDVNNEAVAKVSKERRAFTSDETSELVLWVEEKALEKGVNIDKEKVINTLNSLWMEKSVK